MAARPWLRLTSMSPYHNIHNIYTHNPSTGSSVTTYTILPSGGLLPLQSFTFKLTAPGTNPSRQDAPHPHEALLDPTGKYIMVPDLGADLVRVFTIDPTTSKITASTPLSVVPGSGPRHGAFLVSGPSTFFFLVTELGNTVTTYNITYGANSLSFKETFTSGIYGPNMTAPPGAAAAEAVVSPDKRFLLTSSRGDNLLTIPNFNPANSTKIVSDTLQAWSINPSTGALAFEQLAPAGGSYPRQFSVNKAGTMAAVGLQNSASVVIVERDVKTGLYGDFVGEIGIAGQITSVIWDE